MVRRPSAFYGSFRQVAGVFGRSAAMRRIGAQTAKRRAQEQQTVVAH